MKVCDVYQIGLCSEGVTYPDNHDTASSFKRLIIPSNDSIAFQAPILLKYGALGSTVSRNSLISLFNMLAMMNLSSFLSMLSPC